MRTKWHQPPQQKRQRSIRTKWPTPKPKRQRSIRTKYPPPKQISRSAYVSGNGPVFQLSEAHCKALERIYTPPLSELEIMEKEAMENLRPDMSHMTPWDPSKRK